MKTSEVKEAEKKWTKNCQRWKAPTPLGSGESGWGGTRLTGATQREHFQNQGDQLLQRAIPMPGG